MLISGFYSLYLKVTQLCRRSYFTVASITSSGSQGMSEFKNEPVFFFSGTNRSQMSSASAQDITLNVE